MVKYLVGLDSSPSGKLALARALSLMREGDQLVAVTVTDIVHYFTVTNTNATQTMDQIRQEMTTSAERVLAAAKAQVAAAGVPESSLIPLVVDGTPREVLCQLAKDHHVDVIVVGQVSSNKSQQHIGSTADYVLRNAPCDCLLVRQS